MTFTIDPIILDSLRTFALTLLGSFCGTLLGIWSANTFYARRVKQRAKLTVSQLGEDVPTAMQIPITPDLLKTLHALDHAEFKKRVPIPPRMPEEAVDDYLWTIMHMMRANSPGNFSPEERAASVGWLDAHNDPSLGRFELERLKVKPTKPN